MQGTAIIVLSILAMGQARHRGVKQNRGGQDMRGDKGGTQREGDRRGKFFGIFNIVTFPNDVCNGTNDLQG